MEQFNHILVKKLVGVGSPLNGWWKESRLLGSDRFVTCFDCIYLYYFFNQIFFVSVAYLGGINATLRIFLDDAPLQWLYETSYLNTWKNNDLKLLSTLLRNGFSDG